MGTISIVSDTSHSSKDGIFFSPTIFVYPELPLFRHLIWQPVEQSNPNWMIKMRSRLLLLPSFYSHIQSQVKEKTVRISAEPFGITGALGCVIEEKTMTIEIRGTIVALQEYYGMIPSSSKVHWHGFATVTVLRSSDAWILSLL